MTRRRAGRSSAGGRRGSSVVEGLVAMLLGIFVLHLALVTLDHLRSREARSRLRHDAVLSARVVRSVIGRELRYLDMERDIDVGPESLSLRAFRGAGLVCGVDSARSSYLVGFLGARRPAPGKDSLELIMRDGSVRHAGLVGSDDTSEPCSLAGPASTPMLWRVDSMSSASPVALRIFERGSYHLSGAAFRYRIGAGGRQPLTPELWDDALTGWHTDDSSLSVTLTPRDGGAHWRAFLGWRVW